MTGANEMTFYHSICGRPLYGNPQGYTDAFCTCVYVGYNEVIE